MSLFWNLKLTNAASKNTRERTKTKLGLGPRLKVLIKSLSFQSWVNLVFFCYFDIISGMGEGVKGGKQDLWLMQHVQRSTRNDLSMTENIDNNCGGQFI